MIRFLMFYDSKEFIADEARKIMCQPMPDCDENQANGMKFLNE